MKQNLKFVGICILGLMISFFLSFLYFFSIMSIFTKLKAISPSLGFTITIIVSSIVAILIIAYVIRRLRSSKKNRFDNWLAHNYPKLILYYIISSIIFISISPEITWTSEKAEKMLSLQWSIFSLSIAVFLVWDVFVMNYLKSKKPKIQENEHLFQKLKYFEERCSFYQDVNTTFNSVALLAMNLLVLLVATVTTYIIDESITLFGQNILVASFYLCTNTLFSLFFNIVSPLYEEKKALLKDIKLSNEDIKLQNDANDLVSNIETTMDIVSELQTIDDEHKKLIFTELLSKLIGQSQNDDEKSS